MSLVTGGASTMGLLWRPDLADVAESEAAAGRLGFVEVIAESLVGAHRLPAPLESLRSGGIEVVPHGVGLGLGGGTRPGRRRMIELARVAELCGAPLVSEHVAFVRSGRVEAGHLLPVAYTRSGLDVLVANVDRLTRTIEVPLALEPIAALVDWPNAEMSEGAFLSELVDRTGVRLLLDVANLHVNAANRRRSRGSTTEQDPANLLDHLPLDRVAYVHAAGGHVRHGWHHDTHTDPLWPEAVHLVEELWSRVEPPGLLLERDHNAPPAEQLRSELRILAAAARSGRARRCQVGNGRQPSRSPIGRDRAGWHRPALIGRARREVSADQASLLAALAGRSPAPVGIDGAGVDELARVLARKRAGAVAHLMPELAVAPRFVDRFEGWARRNPQGPSGPTGDALAYYRSLPEPERSLPAAATLARLLVTALAGRSRHRWRPRVYLIRSCQSIVVTYRIGRWTGQIHLGHR